MIEKKEAYKRGYVHPLLKPDTILFDWDSTLVDTWAGIHTAMNKTLKKYNCPTWGVESYKKHAHFSSKNLFPDVFKKKWQEARNFFYESIKDNHLKELKVLPYAFELLTFLKDKKIPMGVISNKHRDFLKKEVDCLGWQDFFQVVIGSGDTIQDKPHPEPILLALTKMGLCPSDRHWYVGDTITDWQAAHASGCQPVALWTDPIQENIQTDFPLPYLESCHALYLKVAGF